ncbi:MAG: hypothetical protein L6V93_15320 [Clostridiales bacterium]|nr:MAG: hypothetical protein L6V93_15320 [Clostridiales bacterium]
MMKTHSATTLLPTAVLDTLKTYKTLADAEPDGTPGDGTATVSWENDDNASYYKFYKDGELFRNFSIPDPSGTTSVNVTGLANGTECTFGVEPFSKNFTPNTVKTVAVTPEEAEEPAPENHMISNLSVNPYTFGGTGGAATVSFKKIPRFRTSHLLSFTTKTAQNSPTPHLRLLRARLMFTL